MISFLVHCIFSKGFELLKDYKIVKKINIICLIHIHSVLKMVELFQVDRLKKSKVYAKKYVHKYQYYRKIILRKCLSGRTLIEYITNKIEGLLRII